MKHYIWKKLTGLIKFTLLFGFLIVGINERGFASTNVQLSSAEILTILNQAASSGNPVLEFIAQKALDSLSDVDGIDVNGTSLVLSGSIPSDSEELQSCEFIISHDNPGPKYARIGSASWEATVKDAVVQLSISGSDVSIEFDIDLEAEASVPATLEWHLAYVGNSGFPLFLPTCETQKAFDDDFNIVGETDETLVNMAISLDHEFISYPDGSADIKLGQGTIQTGTALTGSMETNFGIDVTSTNPLIGFAWILDVMVEMVNFFDPDLVPGIVEDSFDDQIIDMNDDLIQDLPLVLRLPAPSDDLVNAVKTAAFAVYDLELSADCIKENFNESLYNFLTDSPDAMVSTLSECHEQEAEEQARQAAINSIIVTFLLLN